MGALHKFYEHINFWNDLGAFNEAYTYNVRGAMTKRKSDVFEQNILFTGKFNGSIASINDKLADGLSMTSWYTYDKAGRLTQANMKVGGTPRYVDYTYDLNGNITSLVRDGDDGIDPIAWIDNLTYTYDGNKVRKITDTNGDVISERTMDFPDLADLDVEYGYDRNGNMTWDANRGVHMQWDANNRLSCAYYNPGVLSFTRSATGRRLSRSYSPNQSVALVGGTIKKGRSYADFPSFGGFDRPGQGGFPIIDTYDTYGAYEYENGKFSRLNTTTGYRDSLGVHVYVRDYQGNIRAVVRKGADGKAVLEQATYYYPYGMPMAESTNPTANRYKYTGKELLTDHGVNILDYGPRPYDPVTNRWLSVDAFSQKTPAFSHFVFCNADPINHFDPDGNLTWPVPSIYKGLTPRHENNYHAPRKGNRLHQGIDINIGSGEFDYGAPVYSTHDGKVVSVVHYTDDKKAGGTRVRIQSENGEVSTSYMHLSEIEQGIDVGVHVIEGQRIGAIGKSGFGVEKYIEYASHLHYEIKVNGKNINPAASPTELKDAQRIIYPVIDNNDYREQLQPLVVIGQSPFQKPQLVSNASQTPVLPDKISMP